MSKEGRGINRGVSRQPRGEMSIAGGVLIEGRFSIYRHSVYREMRYQLRSRSSTEERTCQEVLLPNAVDYS